MPCERAQLGPKMVLQITHPYATIQLGNVNMQFVARQQLYAEGMENCLNNLSVVFGVMIVQKQNEYSGSDVIN